MMTGNEVMYQLRNSPNNIIEATTINSSSSVTWNNMAFKMVWAKNRSKNSNDYRTKNWENTQLWNSTLYDFSTVFWVAYELNLTIHRYHWLSDLMTSWSSPCSAGLATRLLHWCALVRVQKGLNLFTCVRAYSYTNACARSKRRRVIGRTASIVRILRPRTILLKGWIILFSWIVRYHKLWLIGGSSKSLWPNNHLANRIFIRAKVQRKIAARHDKIFLNAVPALRGSYYFRHARAKQHKH